MQNTEQRRIDDEGLGLTDQLGHHLSAQGFQETPEPPETAMEGRRSKTHHTREQVREEPLGVAQTRPFTLHAPQLLEECEGYDLRVRELLERCVASSARVEVGVGIIYEAEQHGDRLFKGRESRSMLHLGHPEFLSLRGRMAPVVPSIHATDI